MTTGWWLLACLGCFVAGWVAAVVMFGHALRTGRLASALPRLIGGRTVRRRVEKAERKAGKRKAS